MAMLLKFLLLMLLLLLLLLSDLGLSINDVTMRWRHLWRRPFLILVANSSWGYFRARHDGQKIFVQWYKNNRYKMSLFCFKFLLSPIDQQLYQNCSFLLIPWKIKRTEIRPEIFLTMNGDKTGNPRYKSFHLYVTT